MAQVRSRDALRHQGINQGLQGSRLPGILNRSSTSTRQHATVVSEFHARSAVGKLELAASSPGLAWGAAPGLTLSAPEPQSRRCPGDPFLGTRGKTKNQMCHYHPNGLRQGGDAVVERKRKALGGDRRAEAAATSAWLGASRSICRQSGYCLGP